MAAFLEAPDRIAHVRAQVALLQGRKSGNSDYTMIQCPFHNDGTPSGRVRHEARLPRSIGYFSCWGCGEHMPWNDFSKRVGLLPFDGKKSNRVPKVNLQYIEEQLLGEEKPDHEEYKLTNLKGEKARETLGLPQRRWRTFAFKFLRKVGARVIHVNDSKGRPRCYVYLPVLVGGVLRGYIKALPKKIKDLPGYFNAPGGWSSRYGLFLYDQSVQLMEEKGWRTLVIVEGPRDALRLFERGIPAVAILGTQSWSSAKVMLLEQSGARSVIICTDADKAGRKAAKLLYSGKRKGQDVATPLHEVFENVSRFPLEDYKKNPKDEDEKLDPCDAPDVVFDDLLELLE